MNIADRGMTMLSANRSVTGRRRGLARRTHWVAALTAFGIVGAALPHAHAQTTLYDDLANGRIDAYEILLVGKWQQQPLPEGLALLAREERKRSCILL